jgi:hypothetical protein
MYNTKFIKSFYNLNKLDTYKKNFTLEGLGIDVVNRILPNQQKLTEHFKYFINLNTFSTKNNFNVHFN